jgi:hypothetical protein
MIEAISIFEEMEGLNGGTVYFVIQDVQNAFPLLWEDGVDWILR